MFIYPQQINNSQYPIVSIIRNKNKYELTDSDTIQFVPQSRQKIEQFVKDLNSNQRSLCVRYGWIGCLFLPLYIISFVLIMVSTNAQFVFVPIIFFFCFVVSMICSSYHQMIYFRKTQRLISIYQSRLGQFYQIKCNSGIYQTYRRNYYHPNFDIQLWPIPGNNFSIQNGFGPNVVYQQPNIQQPMQNMNINQDGNQIQNLNQQQNMIMQQQQGRFNQIQNAPDIPIYNVKMQQAKKNGKENMTPEQLQQTKF